MNLLFGTLAVLFIAAIIIIGIVNIFGLAQGKRPENLGVHDNILWYCPKMPNCVSSDSIIPDYDIAALPFDSTPEKSISNIRDVVLSLHGITIVTERSDYIYAECRSRIIGFVDDLEVYCEDLTKTCHVRSAARLGYSDFDVNRKRVEKIRALLK